MNPLINDPQSAQQALELLEKVQIKVLSELWTTIMLCGGLLSVSLSEVCRMMALPRVGSVFIVLYGYTMTWVPATMATWLGFTCMFLGIANILRVSLAPKPALKA